MAKRAKQKLPSAPACSACAYRALADSHPDGLLVIDRQGALRFSNPAASQMLGVALQPGLPVRDQAGEHAVLRELPRAPDGTWVIRVPRGGRDKARLLEARTAEMQWEGQAGVLVCLHEAPEHAGRGRRWSSLVAAYRGLWSSFHRSRPGPGVHEDLAEEPLIVPDPSPDRLAPDALRHLDRVLETLCKGELPPKGNA